MSITKKRLGDLCRIKGGYSFKSTDYQSEGIPLIRISNIYDEEVKLNGDTVFLPKDFIKQYKDFSIDKGDILIALSGATTGKYGIYKLNEPSLLNQRIGIIKLNEAKGLNTKFVYYYLPVLKSKILNNAKGAAQPNISTKDIEEFEIPYFDLDKQDEIVKILDKASSVIQKRKETIKLADEFLRSTFLDMFGDPNVNPKNWDQLSFKEFCNFSQGIQIPLEEQTNERKKGYNRFLRISDYTAKVEERFVHIEDQKYFVKKDDIVVVRYGASAGFIGFGKEGILANNLFKINFDRERINPYFLYYFLKLDSFQNFIHKVAFGAAMPALSFEVLYNFSVYQPDKKLQDKFSEIVIKTEKLKEKYQTSLTEMENQFNSLMQRAFRGEL